MKRLILAVTFHLAIVSCTAGAASAAGKEFYDAWSDGNGEINVYHLTEERYGEPRHGRAVLVYVAEELNRNTYVKVESDATPPNERMFVIKLNKLLRFPTGLYDYAVMTSVFSVADSHLGHHPFQAARVTHTTQEWCGQTFERIDLREDGWHHRLRSYFESEGDRDEVLPANGTELEDNLWVWIRELDGEFLAAGTEMTIELIPSTWQRRKTHQPPEAVTVQLKKEEPVTFLCEVGTYRAYPWSWTVDGRSMGAFVEVGGQQRLLGWTDSRGGTAQLASSERVPYWRLNGNESLEARDRMRLPSQTLEGTPDR